MRQETIVISEADLEVLKREVAERYQLGGVREVENIDYRFSRGDYNYVVFHGADRTLTCSMKVGTVGDKYEILIMPKSIDYHEVSFY